MGGRGRGVGGDRDVRERERAMNVFCDCLICPASMEVECFRRYKLRCTEGGTESPDGAKICSYRYLFAVSGKLQAAPGATS